MFFIMGISSGEKVLNFVSTRICKSCGRYGRYEAFMTYTFLSLFFIPVFKWNKHYYLRTSCCNMVYEISPELGKRIARGEQVDISDNDLHFVYGQGRFKRCPKCGFVTDEDFTYCPKCSERLI
jgi:hypothetical protein